MNEYRRYPVVQRKIVCTCCLLLCSLASLGGCQPGFVESTWTLIEVLDSRSGDAVSDVAVTVDGAAFESGPDGVTIRDPGPLPLAPTDLAGRTYVPVLRIGSRPFSVDLALRLEHGPTVENITIPNRTGALVETNDLTVRIVEVGADGPPPPLLTTVSGSRPAQISVNGYVSVLVLCSNADNGSTFQIRSAHEGAYVGAFTIGSVPLGFESVTCTDPIDPATDPYSCLCPVSVRDRMPPNGFTVVAFPVFGLGFDDYIEGESFCLDSEGTVIACP